MQSYLWYFYVYAFLGWCTEVVFAALKSGHFVNRGFLNGPVCPIYGCGLVAVLFLLQPFQHNVLTLYAGSVVLTTSMELATGFLMEKLFHHRWWDYSKMPLNIGGYVCPLFSLLWGVACVLIVDVLHPRIAGLVALIPQRWGVILLFLFNATFLLDVIVTVVTVSKLNQRLKQIDDVAAALRLVSDRLGETMADGALAIKATDELACDDLVTARERTRDALREADEATRAELKARYSALVERLELGQRRILKAFPALRSIQYPIAMDAIRVKLTHLWENRKKRG